MVKPTLEDAKNIVLCAAYDALYHTAQLDALSAKEIHNQISNIFSIGYTLRILNNLSKDQLIQIITDDEFGSSTSYFLTDAGLELAQGLPALSVLTLQFPHSVIGNVNIPIPASDRIVQLNHNQVTELETPIAKVIDALQQDNGDAEQPGLRERLLGQVKAGRELITSGEFRAYLLYETLIRALGELISKYKNPTILALANALVSALLSQIFQD